VRKAVYVDSANYLYSEVRNAPGTGNALHQAGWFEAWRHPMLTDWVFSKRKIGEGITTSIARAASRVPGGRMAGRLILVGGNLQLERTLPGGAIRRYTLEGRALEP
jgi:hypothetical protein